MYENVEFPTLPDRPYFYVNFVATLDGKVDVPARHAEYWPIGGAADRKEFINLRIPADALIHGRGTAMAHRAVDSLAKPEFKAARKARGREKDLLYVIVSGNPNEALRLQLKNDAGIEPLVVGGDDLPAVARDLKQKGMDAGLIEGGPRLAASFFAADLVDEIFLTIAPKVFGGGGVETLTMVEGSLLPPERTGHWKLISAIPVEDEVFLRYRR